MKMRAGFLCAYTFGALFRASPVKPGIQMKKNLS